MAGDSNFDKVRLLLHCDGANGSTVFTDSSPVHRAVTANGLTAISADPSAFGGTSAFINGGSLSVAGSPDLLFGRTDDFTIETFVNFSSVGFYQCLFCSDSAAIGTNTLFIRLRSGNNIYANAGTSGGIYGTTTIKANTRYHIAVVRASNLLYLFVNGNLEGTLSSPNAITDPLRWFGNYSTLYGGGGAVSGYMEEIRVTAWARYTAPFTPPTGPFPDSAGVTGILAPTIKTVVVSGGVPVLAAGKGIKPAGAAQLNVIGGIPIFGAAAVKLTPAAGQIRVTGETPAAPFIARHIARQGRVGIVGGVPGMSLGFAGTPVSYTLPITGLQPQQLAHRLHSLPTQGTVAVSGLSGGTVKLGAGLTPQMGTVTFIGDTPTVVSRLLKPIPPIWIATRYRCYLTGAENGLATDVELPISSFQTRISGESVSYLSCVLKGADRYVDEIAQRQAGKLRIWRIYVLSDGTESPFLMAEVAFEQMDLATGGKSGVTAQLSGTGNMVPQTPQAIALQHPSYFGLSGGKHRYRCEIDPRLRPGDTATVNNTTFVVGNITHIVDVKTAVMEIAEA